MNASYIKIPENKYDLVYNYMLMVKVLDKIANAPEGSTVEGCTGLAQLTLDGLK